MTKVGVVTLAVTRGTFGTNMTSRAKNFSTLVAQAAALFNGSPDLKLFVAPEYFFSKFDSSGTKVDGTKGELAPVSQSSKMDLYKGIAAASKLHPNILIVAGTIFYTRGKNSIEGLNVCPIAIGGKIKHKIYKQNDDGWLKDYDPHSTFESKKIGSRFYRR